MTSQTCCAKSTYQTVAAMLTQAVGNRFVPVFLCTLALLLSRSVVVISRGIEDLNHHGNGPRIEAGDTMHRRRRDLPESVIAWGDFKENRAYNAYRSGFPDGFSLETFATGRSSYYNTTYVELFLGLPSR